MERNLNTIFDHVKLLYECELYSECIRLSSVLLSAYDQLRSLLTPQEHYLTLMYNAESLYQERRFRNAETVYRLALITKKGLLKSKSPNVNKSTDNLFDLFPDASIKFKIAKCLSELRRFEEAITTLQSIPLKQRTPKINFFIGKLTLHINNERGSISAFKEVLKECPLALETMEKLLEVGVKGCEVNSLVLETAATPQCSDWLCNWIKAQDLIYCKKYNQAIHTMRSIESNTIFRNSNMLLSLIGETYYLIGEYDMALNYFKRAYNLYQTNSMGIQLHAKILAKKKKINELERLIPVTSTTAEYTGEMWYVMAQFLFSSNKFEKAAYYAQKALFISPRNVEALLLKCRVYIEVKKQKEALTLLRVVQQLVPHRYEVYKILVGFYTNLYRFRDAQATANLAIKTIGQTPRTLVLLAQTYTNDRRLKSKEKILLQKALEMDEYCLPAVVLLADSLQSEGDINGAIALLKKQVAVQPNCTLHSMLGDLLKNTKDQSGALENYTVALNLDPLDRQAMAGLMAISRSNSNTIDTSYTISTVTEETPEITSDFQELVELVPPPEGDPESESDAMWSDVEIEIPN